MMLKEQIHIEDLLTQPVSGKRDIAFINVKKKDNEAMLKEY